MRVALVRVTSTPEFAFAQTSVTASEGGSSLILNVTRSGITTGPVSIHYSTEAGTARAGSDFTATDGTLTWQPDDPDTKTLTIALGDDSANEMNEEFKVQLSDPSEGSIGAGIATITVADNDPLPSGGGGGFDILVSIDLLLLGLAYRPRTRLKKISD